MLTAHHVDAFLVIELGLVEPVVVRTRRMRGSFSETGRSNGCDYRIHRTWEAS